MTAPTRAVLYSRELLGLAVELADYPYDPAAPFLGDARSRSCGSTLSLSFADGFEALGMRVSACAVGQAAAAVFAASVHGCSAQDISAAATAIERWLAGEGDTPQWPRIGLLSPALPYRGRHEAILLPWRAAGAALSKGQARG